MNKKNVLIVYNYLLHYRKPLFNLLSKEYNLYILHSGNSTVLNEDFYNEIIVLTKKIGPFFFQNRVLNEVRNPIYDIIIVLFDVRWISSIISIFAYSKKARFILWGAWFTNSKIANKIRLLLSTKADASIFYTYSSMLDFLNHGIKPHNLYVANNTVDIGLRIKSYQNKNKHRFLFVGSLDKRKQLDILIKAFTNIVTDIPNHIILTIIGQGSEKENLMNLTNELNITHRVEFIGQINDTSKLNEYYYDSFISISFGQAGLSVLQSLGFGVPFLTKKNAISGGEITNIKNNVNGFLCDDNIQSLQKYLIYIGNNHNELLKMGENAYNYYSEYCTIENYALGFKDAIEGTRNAKIDTSNQ